MVDLYEGTSIWKVSIERCREQDINAQVMDKATFDRLKLNIEKDGRLESLPLGYVKKNPAGNEEFFIVSGHHRIRAARSAAVKVIYVMVIDAELTEDQIKSKQLAHNAIVGDSDPQVLKQLFESIKDLDQKIASGVRDSDFDKMKFRAIAADDISVDYEFRTVKLMFLPSQLDKFEKVIAQMLEHETVMVTKMEEFEPFAKALREVSKREDIRNVSSILQRMCEITMEYYKYLPEDEDAKKMRRVIGFSKENNGVADD